MVMETQVKLVLLFVKTVNIKRAFIFIEILYTAYLIEIKVSKEKPRWTVLFLLSLNSKLEFVTVALKNRINT